MGYVTERVGYDEMRGVFVMNEYILPNEFVRSRTRVVVLGKMLGSKSCGGVLLSTCFYMLCHGKEV